MFPGTVLPRDFDTIEIPFAERGGPTLVRWDGAEAGARRPQEAETGEETESEEDAEPRTEAETGAEAGTGAEAEIAK